MKAVVLQRPGDLAVRSVPEPRLGAGDVLVEVAWCGICGTDRSIFHGTYGGRTLPLTLGHEFSGRIAEDPSGRLAPGTPVVADINISCGRCAACRRGDAMTCPELAQIGVDQDGAFAPLVAVPASALHVLPAGLALEVAAMTEPVACVVHAQSKLNWTPGDAVLILGAGPAGHLHARLAAARGCTRVIVADVRPERLNALEGIPGLVALDARDDVAARVRERTDGAGADIVVEASGAPAAWDTAFAAVRAGGQLLAFGISGPEAIVPMRPRDVLVRELTVRGSNGSSSASWPVAIELLASGRIDVSRLIVDRIDLGAVVERITAEDQDVGVKSLASPRQVAA